MARVTKYGIRELRRDFGTEKACLEFIFDSLHTRKCSCGGNYSLRIRRRKFQCSKCRFQIAPTAETIFHKSSTPLVLWFHALMMFSNAKSGISAKQLEHQLAVTYKCAWRMLAIIRKVLPQEKTLLKGDVETDGAYFGGRKKAGKDNKYLRQAFQAKSVVLGAKERGGNMRALLVPNMKAEVVTRFIKENVEQSGIRLMTDGSRSLQRFQNTHNQHFVDHHRGEYVRGDIHINGMENFWSHTKRSITGTYKVISKKHVQSYLDGFVFHHNNRYNDRERFLTLLQIAVRAAREQEKIVSS
jgi:transposase